MPNVRASLSLGLLVAGALAIMACDGADGSPAATPSGEQAGILQYTPPPRYETWVPLPTPTLQSYLGVVNFDHPGGEVEWDGPEGAVIEVTTKGNHHCGAPEELRADFGIPSVVDVWDEEGVRGYWFVRALSSESGLRWTGYHHGDWQLWQGDDDHALYLIHADAPGLAFEYRALGCD
jgi:hypothetical protein